MVAWDGRQSSYENRFVSLISVSQKKESNASFLCGGARAGTSLPHPSRARTRADSGPVPGRVLSERSAERDEV